VGIVVAAVTAFTNIAAVPVTQGSVVHLTYVAMLVVPVLLVFAGMGVVARRRKAISPLLWREARRSAVVAAVSVPLYVGFLVWARQNGLSPGDLTAVTLFLAGLFALMGALSGPGRRYMLGWAVSTMLAGAGSLVCSYASAGILVGGWLFLGGLSSAGIMAWQLGNRSGHDEQRL